MEWKTHLLHGLKHVWLPILVPIRADSKVDLARVFIRFESLGDT